MESTKLGLQDLQIVLMECFMRILEVVQIKSLTSVVMVMATQMAHGTITVLTMPSSLSLLTVRH